MALTVPPPTPFSELGWIFHDNHFDSSIYQDEDIMEFSDSSADYQTPPHQTAEPQQQHQQQVSVCLDVYPKKKKKTKESCDDVLLPLYLIMSVSKLTAFRSVLIRKAELNRAIYSQISKQHQFSRNKIQFRYVKV